MTIAAGFECETGFIFCADQLVTRGGPEEAGSFANYESKIFSDEGGNYGVLLTGSGATDIIKSFSQSFFRNLGQKESVENGFNFRETRNVFEQTLMEFSNKTDRIINTQMLVTVSDRIGQSWFLRSEGLIVSDADPVEILGIGETSLIRYLTDSLHRATLSLEELAALGIFVVGAAKKYCPQYCGGDTDVLGLIDGRVHLVADADEIRRAEYILGRDGKKYLSDLLVEAARVIGCG